MKLTIFACLLLCWSRPAAAQPNITAWELLMTGLDHKNPEKRKQAVAAIGSIGRQPEVIKAVEHGLRDDDPIVRQTAAAELEQMKSTESIPALKAALEDPSGEVQFVAARALWNMGDRSGDQTIQEVLTGQQKTRGGFVDGALRDARTTMHSPKALAHLGVKEASGMLLGPFSIGVTAAEEMLKDTGATGRALAATMLSQHCNEANLQALETALKSEKNNAVRATIAKSLGQCGNKDDVPRLEAYLSSGNDALRFMSAAAIVRLTSIPQR